MKTRESGMPSEELWHSFFDPTATLARLGLTPKCNCVVDFGCGYGTFAVPAARMVQGIVYAIDIDSEMIVATRAKADGLSNLRFMERDFVETGCGLGDGQADYVLLFNILHAQEATSLLQEAKRVLNATGKLGVLHWNYDPSTPRGPSMDIRLTPDRCKALITSAGFATGDPVDLPPYHFGFVATPDENFKSHSVNARRVQSHDYRKSI